MGFNLFYKTLYGTGQRVSLEMVSALRDAQRKARKCGCCLVAYVDEYNSNLPIIMELWQDDETAVNVTAHNSAEFADALEEITTWLETSADAEGELVQGRC